MSLNTDKPTPAELDAARDYIAKRGMFYARHARQARVNARWKRDAKQGKCRMVAGALEHGARLFDREAREHEKSTRAMADSLIAGGMLHA